MWDADAEAALYEGGGRGPRRTGEEGRGKGEEKLSEEAKGAVRKEMERDQREQAKT